MDRSFQMSTTGWSSRALIMTAALAKRDKPPARGQLMCEPTGVNGMPLWWMRY
jgi:hypothetical protein